MILNRYILRHFFKIASGMVFLCVFFFILFDFIQKAAGYLSRYNPSTGLLIEYYLMQTPFELNQMLPIAALIASVVVYMLLARTGEVTAMRSAGMSPFQISKPIVLGGIFLTLLSFLLGEFIIPYSSKRSHYIKQILIERGQAGFNEGAYWVRSPELILNFKSYDALKQSLKKVKVLYLSEKNFAPEKIIEAESTLYSPTQASWILQNVDIFKFNAEHELADSSHIPFLLMKLPLDPEKLEFERRIPFEMSLFELYSVLKSGTQVQGDILSYRIAWYMKLAFPFAALLMSLLGVRFAYQIERTSEKIRSLFITLALGISYWLILSASKALCSAGSLHPFFAGWLANFWLMGILTLQFISLYKREA